MPEVSWCRGLCALPHALEYPAPPATAPKTSKDTRDQRRHQLDRELHLGHLRRFIVEYEPDTELRDTEQIPLREEGGIDAFQRREVLPYAPDAWYRPERVKIGYEISFSRYFHKPQPMRTLEEIRAGIIALETEADGLLEDLAIR